MRPGSLRSKQVDGQGLALVSTTSRSARQRHPNNHPPFHLLPNYANLKKLPRLRTILHNPPLFSRQKRKAAIYEQVFVKGGSGTIRGMFPTIYSTSPYWA